eukprot:TRINITY_DN80405_c0_g1_i1.p1 TRINITY_DN80405_c0_g1~~TRINITY_DN80405_c0_g1_i1.p1  ORF type:complete len:882 (+),score=110.47 TRINITY_DN80405_c0_g1_i1:24-2648(+)
MPGLPGEVGISRRDPTLAGGQVYTATGVHLLKSMDLMRKNVQLSDSASMSVSNCHPEPAPLTENANAAFLEVTAACDLDDEAGRPVKRRMSLRTIVILAFLLSMLCVAIVAFVPTFFNGKSSLQLASEQSAQSVASVTQVGVASVNSLAVESHANIERLGQQAFTSVSTVVTELVRHLNSQINASLIEFARVPQSVSRLFAGACQRGAIHYRDQKVWKALLLEMLRLQPTTVFLAIGFEDNGYYYGVERQIGDTYDKWYVLNASYPDRRLTISLAENGDEIAVVKQKLGYDPRKRDWYKLPPKVNGPYWTDPYLYSDGSQVGITAGVPAYEPNGTLLGVISSDVVVASVTAFLRSLEFGKNGIGLLLNKKTGLPLAASFYEPLFRTNNATGSIDFVPVNGIEHELIRGVAPFLNSAPSDGQLRPVANDSDLLLAVQTIRDPFGLDWVTIIVLRLSDFAGEISRNLSGTQAIAELAIQRTVATTLNAGVNTLQEVENVRIRLSQRLGRNRNRDVGLTAVSLVLLLGIAVFLAHIISSPLTSLAEALLDLSRLTLRRQSTTGFGSSASSHIYEVLTLQRALARLTGSLESFKKYVPEDIVRLQMQLEEVATLGVHQADVSIYFSDIEGFTSISANLEPRVLNDLLAQYLGEMSGIIIHAGGVVDKFIGDAIVAFWNDPHPVLHYQLQSCHAAWDSQQRLQELNKEWCSQGLPRVRCRIGLNCGIVLAGNFGCELRLDYTILGDAVNLASRLESLSKHYGVYTLISAELHEHVRDVFLCRPLDKVAVKGRDTKGGTTVFEICSKTSEATDAVREKVSLTRRAFEKYLERDFSAASSLYGELAARNDTAAAPLLRRCVEFLRTPPPPSWDGVHHMTEK